jgi:hypothetical protein
VEGEGQAARGAGHSFGRRGVPDLPPPRPIGAGRREGRVSDAGLEPASVDTSGEIRVRGKERELSVAREERRAREELWESEVETTVIREEKAEYEDKIKRLEEEVQRLRAEVRVFLAPMFCPSSRHSESLLFFKAGEATHNFHRLLVFATDAPTSAPTATAPTTATAPCSSPHTDHTGDYAGVLY